MNSLIEVAEFGWEKSVGSCDPKVIAGQVGRKRRSELILGQDSQIFGIKLFYQSSIYDYDKLHLKSRLDIACLVKSSIKHPVSSILIDYWCSVFFQIIWPNYKRSDEVCKSHEITKNKIGCAVIPPFFPPSTDVPVCWGEDRLP